MEEKRLCQGTVWQGIPDVRPYTLKNYFFTNTWSDNVMEFPHQRKSRRIFEKGGSLQVLILWYRKSQARSERFDKPWRRKGGTRKCCGGTWDYHPLTAWWPRKSTPDGEIGDVYIYI